MDNVGGGSWWKKIIWYNICIYQLEKGGMEKDEHTNKAWQGEFLLRISVAVFFISIILIIVLIVKTSKNGLD